MKNKLITIAILLTSTLSAQKTFVSTIEEVDLSKKEQSGYVNWDFTNNTTGFAWTWGAPGMLVYGDTPEMCLDIEAEIKNIEYIPSAGISISVNESSTDSDLKFNGSNGSDNYYLALENNMVKLFQGTNNTPEDYMAPELYSSNVSVNQSNWYKLRLKIENDTIYGYVNDTLHIKYHDSSIKQTGKFAIVSSNSENTYKNIKARYHDNPHYISSDTIVEFVSDTNHPEWNNLPVTRLDNVETVIEDDGLDHFISHYIQYKESEIPDNDECDCICPELTTLSIYPNPVSEYINVSIQQPEGNLKVYSMHGAFTRSYNLKYGINRIDMTIFPSGHYIFKVEYDGRKALVEKIIVTH